MNKEKKGKIMESLKLLPLGGIGGVTKNMYVYEYKNRILIVDCGIGFPQTNMYGVDVLIPDISYLRDRTDQIEAILLTHAHDDHIAALPYILPELPKVPIYGSKLTIAFAQDRLKEHGTPADFREFPDDQSLVLGDFEIESIKVTHSVPDCRHFAIHTPVGTVYHGSDFKFDLTPVDGVVSEYQKMARIGQEGVLCLLSDCLRSEKYSHSLSESILKQTFEREIQDVKGKFIVTSMSSNIHRIQQAIDVATASGRKVAFIGRSIEQNIKTATKLGLFHLPDKASIHKKEINKLPANKVCVIIAGSQGQPESSLARAANGDHTLITIEKEDKVVFSSEPIPGNEDNVYMAVDAISRIGADVAYSDVDDNLHVSGHASAIEQQLLMELINPKFMVPIGGTYRHMVQYRKLAEEMKFAGDNVFLLSDGQTLEFAPDKARLGPEIKLRHIMVDGTGIGDVGNIVLSDRRALASSGIVMVVFPLDRQERNLVGDIQVVSRGFVFMKKSKELIDKISRTAQETLDKNQNIAHDWSKLRREIEVEIQSLIYQETEREPLVLPVVVEV